ncbi:MAG: hypothetical protein QXT76_05395 [Sulfolobales archaeon]
MGNLPVNQNCAGFTKSKKEARIALIKKLHSKGLTLVLILRGVKGLEKVYVLSYEDEVAGLLKQFSAVALEVDQLDLSSLSKFPEQLRDVIINYSEFLERLSSELTSLIG